MKLAFQIAWRFLTSAKRQTLIIILGISVGVSVQVFIGSLISGLQASLVDTTIGQSSQVTIIPLEDDSSISNYDEVVSVLKSDDQFNIVSPALDLGGIVRNGIENTERIVFRGFNFEEANQIYAFDEKLLGDSQLPNNMNEVLLGVELGEKLGVSKGDQIEMLIGTEVYTLTVSGFFDFKVSSLNQTWGVASLETAQGIKGEPVISSIETQINEVFDAETIALTYDQSLASYNLKTKNWMADNQDLLSGLQGQSISSLMIQIFVIISVVLGISSTLAITVMQKSKQIGIMKAMGITDRDASLVFLSEGLFLGVFGAIGGVLFGLGLSYAFTTFALNPDGTPVVPLLIDGGFIALSAGIALVACLLASLTPAIKSSKLTVIEVIRNA
ncbi:MAG: FtsX-like permease family protein [Acholeplasmataceae bacterium]|nr:FtsX-like permease family protein [Acholeplasmataceae bacterium]MDD4194599.1 FtsX-like permease family protein [Acholeplasmataceae bacterium]